MKRFFSFVIKQSAAIILLVLLTLGFGVFATLNMSINLLPDINVPMVCVQVIYPGANAASVEKDVTEKLEEGLSSISGIDDVSGYSYDNLSALVLSFGYGTDTAEKKNDIQGKLSSISLPDGVSTRVYDIDLNAEALAVLSVTSSQGVDEAYSRAKELSAALAAIDGVERTEIKGGAEYSYTVKPFKGFEILCPLIVQSFSYGALDLPLGNVTDNGADVQIRNNSDIKSVEDIINMPLDLPGQLVEILSRVKQFAEFYESKSPEELNQILQQALTNPGSVPSDISSSPYFSAFLNNGHLLENLSTLVNKRAEYGEEISAEEYYDLFGQINFEGVIEVPLSVELIDFVLKTDLTATHLNSDGDTVLTVKTGDIALISDPPEASYSSYAYYRGGEMKRIVDGVTVEVFKSNGANSSAVVKEVKRIYNDLSSQDGYTADISLLDDQSEFISDSISNVLVSMAIGGALAVIIIFLFLKKPRISLIIAVTMPLSVLAALICLYLAGITLNMVSLGGLAVGIGMLVDNSIVVIECISKHRDAGKSAFEAAVDGTVEVGGALFGSTLTTVCVFIPIIFSGGLTAEIFTDLAFAVIFSLTFSLLVAVTVIPALYALTDRGNRLLKGGKISTEPYGGESGAPAAEAEEAQTGGLQSGESAPEQKTSKLKTPFIMDKITAAYKKILPAVLNKKLLTILVAVAVFGASVGLLFLTGTEFLPSVDKGQIEVSMTYGSGEKLETVRSDVLSFSEVIVHNIDGVESISASAGKNGMLALTDSGIIKIQLASGINTASAVEELRELAKSRKTIGTVAVREIDGVVASLTSGTNDMSLTVVGESADTLLEISDKLKTELSRSGFTDIADSATDKSTQYTMQFDRGALAAKGLDYQVVVLTLRMGIASYTACTMDIGGESYGVKVSFADGAVTDRDSLENFIIGYSQSEGKAVKLKEVLKDGGVKVEQTDACIRRSNGKVMISVSAVLPGVDTGSASKKMRTAAEEILKNYEGYSFEESGISSYLTDAFEGLAIALVISFVLLFAVMAVQFGSALKPLIIMASIPFSFTGGFIALVITGTSLNVVSFIGLIMLMGVVVNNAIVMLEKIKQLKDEGKPHYDAVIEACSTRLRPILMTTLTTVLALVPLAIGVGKGSELMQPLGIVVIGGLFLGTLVTLVLIPAVYCAVHRLSKKNFCGNKAVKAEEITEEVKAEEVTEQ